MVATDSYRLSVKHTELEGGTLAEPLEANVPARALRELARVIASAGRRRGGDRAAAQPGVFRAGGVMLFSRLIEGQFPSWRQLIPESFEHDVRLPRAELLEVTRRISQLAQRNAPLRFAFAEGELTVAAETPEIGDASESMPAPYSGRADGDRLQPAVPDRGRRERRHATSWSLRLSSPLRPGLLQPVGSRGLQLPRDADPAQRLDGAGAACWSRRLREVAAASANLGPNLADAEIELGEG